MPAYLKYGRLMNFISLAVFHHNTAANDEQTDCAAENDGSLVIGELVDERGLREVQYLSTDRQTGVSDSIAR